MIRYTVVWLQRAQAQLAQIWLTAPDRNAVSAASATIDTELAEDPDQKGISISGGLQYLTVSPLVAIYSCRPADRVVEVVGLLYLPALSNGVARTSP